MREDGGLSARGKTFWYSLAMRILVRLVLSALSLLIIAHLVPGFTIQSFYAALIAALVLGLINTFIRPIIALFALPFTLITLGIFSFVINAGLLLFVASIVKGFTITNFSAAFFAALLLWLVNMALTYLLSPPKRAFFPE